MLMLVSLIGFLGKSRVKELCGELDVAYDRIIKQVVVNRDVKRADSHAQQSEQYRRLSRFSLRANRAKVHTPWHRLQLQQEMSKQRKSKDGRQAPPFWRWQTVAGSAPLSSAAKAAQRKNGCRNCRNSHCVTPKTSPQAIKVRCWWCGRFGSNFSASQFRDEHR
eukprot:s282_g5.t1